MGSGSVYTGRWYSALAFVAPPVSWRAPLNPPMPAAITMTGISESADAAVDADAADDPVAEDVA